MDAFEAMLTRRSTRKLAQVVPAKEFIEQVVEAGRHAPSGGNSQTTHFLVITNPAVLTKLAKLVQEAFAQMEETPGMYKSVRSLRWFLPASA